MVTTDPRARLLELATQQGLSLAALSAFIAGFVAFGVMYSFGVFFTPMEAEFHASRTATSVFFAITGVLFYSFGSVAGRLSDDFGARRVIRAFVVHRLQNRLESGPE